MPPASWTVRAMSRRVSTGSTTSSSTRHGLIASRQIPKPTNTLPHGQSAPCLDGWTTTHGLTASGQIPKPANTLSHGQSTPCLGFRQPGVDSSRADKSRSHFSWTKVCFHFVGALSLSLLFIGGQIFHRTFEHFSLIMELYQSCK